MKKLLFLIGLFCFSIQVNSQTIDSLKIDDTKNFIYKYDGTLIYNNKIKYRTPLLAKKYFKVGEDKIKANTVKFYRNHEGFFGNVGYNSFAKRIVKGKVNLFEQIVYNVNSVPMAGAGGFGGGMMTTTNTSVTNYYNKGFGDLKLANYENLSIDLADNPISMDFLNKSKEVKKKQVLGYVIGGVATVVGLLTAFKKTGETEESFNPQTGRFETTDKYTVKPGNLMIGVGGLVTLLVTHFKSKKKNNYIKDAIYEYNQ